MTALHSILANRIRAILQTPLTVEQDDGNSAANLVFQAHANLMNFEKMTNEEAIQALAAKGEHYGHNGEMGGMNVYVDDDGTERVDWTTSENCTFMPLGTLVDEAEQPTVGVPSWFEDDWKLVKDDCGRWISKGKRE